MNARNYFNSRLKEENFNFLSEEQKIKISNMSMAEVDKPKNNELSLYLFFLKALLKYAYQKIGGDLKS